MLSVQKCVVCAHVLVGVRMCKQRVSMCVFVRVWMIVLVCECLQLCICVHVCVRARTRTCLRAGLHAYMHTYIYICIDI